jgi:hypothetical protein
VPLAESQAAIRDALVSGDAGPAIPRLVGGLEPLARLAIHQRHYRASLVGTLLTRFPALAWLVGGRPLAAAAESFVRAHPPTAPCLAEYGAGFPEFVTRFLGEPHDSCITPFGVLEWHVGLASMAIDLPVDLGALDAVAEDEVPHLIATLQPGLSYLRTAWPVHDLFERFITDSAPDSYAMPPAQTWLEVRGARGEFRIQALDAPTWSFRQALQRGLTLEASYLSAVERDGAFDVAAALAAASAVGLIVGLRPAH